MFLPLVVAAVGILVQGAPDPSAYVTARVPFAPHAGRAVAVDTVTLHVDGMTCGGCTLATRKVLERLDGVTKADVSYERKRAVVIYDPSRVTAARMIAAVATLKYTATVVPK